MALGICIYASLNPESRNPEAPDFSKLNSARWAAPTEMSCHRQFIRDPGYKLRDCVRSLSHGFADIMGCPLLIYKQLENSEPWIGLSSLDVMR